MDKKELNLLQKQIKSIIQNKPISEELKSEAEELLDLQEAIFYISHCFSESNEFLRNLAVGNLEVKAPDRHNFMAGNLKELHASLKHLTWQANQVANGDYNQRVSFLGDFSNSFNEMIKQLSERELQLEQKSELLAETLNLMKSIMDGLKDWIVVTEKNTGEVIYTNRSAKQKFYDMDIDQHICGKPCELMNHLKHYSEKNSQIYDYLCPYSNKTLCTRSFLIQWNDQLAFAHCIQDITDEKDYREQIEEMAYKDELTGLYNRRFCMNNLEELVEEHREFTFCMVDLDGLKYVNDKFGHTEGDIYLKTVAQEMANVTRSNDIISRIGGDEFSILFSNCSDQVVLNKMEQVDKKLNALSKEYPMSISYGALFVQKENKLTSKEIIVKADERMYHLKKSKKARKQIDVRN